ncbi:MAG: hypothetical protein KatS3mg026_1505 [Bacteroidia bacterium]|nr:MAG: hypothetical protein KatS3mg026_1505 [Bacteroidia bacterium]
MPRWLYLGLWGWGVQIGPVPLKTGERLEAALPGPGTIQIRDARGTLLLQEEVAEPTWSAVLNLPAGWYLFSWGDALGRSAVRRLLVVP